MTGERESGEELIWAYQISSVHITWYFSCHRVGVGKRERENFFLSTVLVSIISIKSRSMYIVNCFWLATSFTKVL